MSVWSVYLLSIHVSFSEAWAATTSAVIQTVRRSHGATPLLTNDGSFELSADAEVEEVIKCFT